MARWDGGPAPWEAARSLWTVLEDGEDGNRDGDANGGASQRVVATVSEVATAAIPFTRPDATLRDEWPAPVRSDLPIALELIRVVESNGNDAWHLVVDGQVCQEKPVDVSTEYEQENNGIPRCGMPPPLPLKEDLTRESRARKVVVACRLEEDALAPAKVDFIVNEVVWSDERRDQARNTEEEVLEMKRYSLTPYDVRDPVAPSVVLPYPFAAPAQSAFSIVSNRELELYYETLDQDDERLTSGKGSRKSVRAQDVPTPDPRIYVIGGMKYSASYQIAEVLDKISSAFDAMVRWEKESQNSQSPMLPKESNFSLQELRIEGVRWVLRQRNEATAVTLFDALAYGPDVLNSSTFMELRKSIAGELQRRGQPKFDLFGISGEDLDEVLLISDPGVLERAERRATGAEERLQAARDGQQYDNIPVFEAVAKKLRAEASGLRAEQAVQKAEKALLSAQKAFDELPSVSETREEQKQKIKTAKKELTILSKEFELCKSEAEQAKNEYNEALFQSEERQRTPSSPTTQPSVESSLEYGIAKIIVPGGDAPHTEDTGVFSLTPTQIAERKEIENDRKKKREGWGALDYDIVYERMQFESRTRTRVAMEFVFEITEVDGRVKRIRVRPDEHFAFAAHAIYSKLADDEFKLQEAVTNFSKALDQIVNQNRTLVNVLQEGRDVLAGFGSTYKQLSTWITARTNAHERKYKEWRARAKKIQMSLSLLNLMCGFETGPSWPPPTELNSQQPPSLPAPKYLRIMPQIVLTKRIALPRFPVPNDIVEPDEWSRPVEYNATWREWMYAISKSAFRIKFEVLKNYMRNVVWEAKNTPSWISTFASFGDSLGRFTGQTVGAAIFYLTTYIPVTVAQWIPATVIGAFTYTLPAFMVAGAAAGSVLGIFYGGRFGAAALKEGAYYKTSVDIALDVAPVIWTFKQTLFDETRRSQERRGKRKEAYEKAVKLAIGTPVLSALANARIAMQGISKQDTEFWDLVFEGSRYYLTQRYVQTEAALAIKGDAPLSDREWTGAPSSSVFALAFPSDVSEALYEAVVLRRVRTQVAIEIVAGSAESDVVAVQTKMAAQAAFDECISFLTESRSTLLPSHLFASAVQSARQLVNDGGELLLAAYGKSKLSNASDVSNAVHGDDIIWSCLPGGSAARLALRHVAAFESTEMRHKKLSERLLNIRKRTRNTDEWRQLQNRLERRDKLRNENFALERAMRNKESSEKQREDVEKARQAVMTAYNQNNSQLYDAQAELNNSEYAAEERRAIKQIQRHHRTSWSIQQQAEIETFVQTWKQTAQNADKREAKQSKVLQERVGIQHMVVAMDSLNKRLNALGLKEAAHLVVSGFPRVVQAMRTHPQPVTRALEHARVTNRAEVQISAQSVIPQATEKAFWASRRMDVDAIASLRNLDPNPNDLVKQLSSLDVSDNVAAGDNFVHYYCPVGDHLDTSPTIGSFLTERLTFTRVRCELLAPLIDIVRRCTVPFNTYARTNAVVVQKTASPRGLSYHPLVVTTRANLISVFTAGVLQIDDITLRKGRENAVLPTLVQVLANTTLEFTMDSAQWLLWERGLAQRAQSIAFNADRYKHAVALAMQRQPPPGLVILRCDSFAVNVIQSTALAFALGLALYESETGAAAPTVALEHPDTKNANDQDAVLNLLKKAREACKHAVESGHPVVYLNEVCYALAAM